MSWQLLEQSFLASAHNVYGDKRKHARRSFHSPLGIDCRKFSCACQIVNDYTHSQCSVRISIVLQNRHDAVVLLDTSNHSCWTSNLTTQIIGKYLKPNSVQTGTTSAWTPMGNTEYRLTCLLQGLPDPERSHKSDQNFGLVSHTSVSHNHAVGHLALVNRLVDGSQPLQVGPSYSCTI